MEVLTGGKHPCPHFALFAGSVASPRFKTAAQFQVDEGRYETHV